MKLTKFNTIVASLIYLWRILYPIFFALIMVAVAWYAFRQNDQGRDFFVGIVSSGISISYVIKSSIMLLRWCILLWYSTRVVLQIKRLEVPSNRFTTFLIKWLPRTIGILPFLIVINAHFHAASIIATEDKQTLWFNSTILLAAAIALMSFFIYRKKLALMMNISFKPDEERYSTGKTMLKEFLESRASKIAIAFITISISLLCLLFFTPSDWGFARWLEPATVVICGLVFFTFLIALIILFIDIRRSPVFLLIGSYVVLLSTCNNNNQIDSLDVPPKRMSIKDNFEQWIDFRIKQQEYSDSSARKFPLFIIAAEGGGIRAATWTSLVLKKLQELRPNFMDHVYAISGVSGGGVGAAFYAAYRYDESMGRHDGFISAATSFERTVSNDFLSDLTAGFIFHDNLQRIIPWPVRSLSRNRKLENSWGSSWRAHMFSNSMDSSFLALWDNSPSFKLPNILINGLLSETGQKAITSNLELNTAEFSDDIDVIARLHSDIPLKTAASLGARFPIITSGALLKANGETPLGHILDGGYKENSGIETAWQLILSLDTLIAKAEIRYGWKIPVHLIFIQNSTNGRTFNENYNGATKVLPDLSTIIPGFMNAWERRTTTHKNISRDLFSGPRMNDHYKFIEIRLNNQDKSLPLGWYLSDAARENIIKQVNAINKTHPSLQY